MHHASLSWHWFATSSIMLCSMCWHSASVSTNSWCSWHRCCAVWLQLVCIPDHSVSSYESHSKLFLISERIKSILCFANWSSCRWEGSRQIIAEKRLFWTFQGTVATFYRCGGQKQLCPISSGFRIPKIILWQSYSRNTRWVLFGTQCIC